ncbi:cytochrome c biogenesis heme-transporting ATPase CcmA [Oceaniserpentilla sp. 4NH20-0058]|uniref:cytochrome c biogenesis heme-transporting ATPase CcmA n=1 Tax=Oceaniserpentilla sp. 4NH20-0058 TaxID=3127660 RepID=UPI00310A3918
MTQSTEQLAATEGPLLSGRNLYCERDDRVLFENLSFDWNGGEIVRLAGPNGSGKSSLIRILLGLSASYEGDVLYQSLPMSQVRYEFRNELLYLGHQVGIKTSLTPEENLNWLCPESSQKEIINALEKVGLTGFEDVLAHGLSAGQQRRVALARLYLQPKRIWVLDEPFTAIDISGVEQLEQRIIEHAQQGGLVVLTTHHQLAVKVTELILGSTQSIQQEAI